jgi:hypothetical protein
MEPRIAYRWAVTCSFDPYYIRVGCARTRGVFVDEVMTELRRKCGQEDVGYLVTYGLESKLRLVWAESQKKKTSCTTGFTMSAGLYDGELTGLTDEEYQRQLKDPDVGAALGY